MLAGIAAGAPIEPPVDAARANEKKKDLERLRERIEALRSELQQKQSSQRETRDALRSSEQAISEANRALAALDVERRVLQAEIVRIRGQREPNARALKAQQEALGRMLQARHAGVVPDALRIALTGDDPARIARTLHYYSYISRATARLLQSFRAGLARIELQAAELSHNEARLTQVEQAQKADRERILVERAQRQLVLDRLGTDIRAGHEQMKILRTDEAELARLVADIGRLLAERSRRKETEGMQPVAPARPFSALRGKLLTPVRGRFAGRYSAQKGATVGSSRGLFIRASAGQAVRVVARGQVVFADWMRGFGNLLIVDHGDAYLSIYGNNEALLKQVGDAVAAGEPIATIGASGGNVESGLYFELRHLGKAFDPLTWVNLK